MNEGGRFAVALLIEVLGTPFEIGSEEVETVELIRLLWRPFVAATPEGSPIKVRLGREGNAWTVALDSEKSLFSDFWPAMDHVNSSIFQLALKRWRGGADLHAAHMALGKTSVLLVGASGAGKSTLAAELMLVDRGWLCCGDDLAPIQPDGSVLPFPKPLCIKDAERWGALKRLWAPPDWLKAPRSTFWIPAGSERGSLRRPAFVVFLERSASSQAELTPLPRAHAIQLCAEFTTKPMRVEAFQAATNVCRNAITARIVYNSPYEAVSILSSLVAFQGKYPRVRVSKK